MSSIAVVIPAYNAEGWLTDAINSVLGQCRQAEEVIVVDDGSTDQTATIAASYADKVRLVRQANLGLSGARNAGARQTAADYVFFLDADDLLLPHALQTLSRIADHCAPDAIIPNFELQAKTLLRRAWSLRQAYVELSRPDVAKLIRANWLGANALVRRSTWARFQYDEDLRSAEDWDLWLRLIIANAKILVLNSCELIKREDHDERLSRDLVAMRRARVGVLDKLLRNPGATARERLIAWMWRSRARLGAALSQFSGPTQRGNSPAAPPGDALASPGVLDKSTTVAQVYLDEAGGGPAHVALLTRRLAGVISTISAPISVAASRAGVSLLRGVIAPNRPQYPKCDLIHAHGVRAAFLIRLTTLFDRRPYVVTVHGLHYIRRSAGIRRWIAFLMSWFALRGAASVLVLSASDGDTVRGSRLAPPERIHLIRAGFERCNERDRQEARRELNLLDGQRVVAWIGRFSPQKDPLTMIHAAAYLEDSQSVVIMAGDGEMFEEAKQLVRGAGLSHRVRLVGWLEEPGLLLAGADAFVSTAAWEGMPLAVLEAAEAGVPLVLSSAPGNSDLLELGIPARSFSVGDALTLGHCLNAVLQNGPHERRGGRLQGFVEAFFPEYGLNDDVLEAYQMVLGARGTVSADVLL